MVIFAGTFQRERIDGSKARPFSTSSKTTSSADTLVRIATNVELSERTIVS
jgi:lysyl-tRNA synthetase class II